jgi:hypothetical protein
MLRNNILIAARIADPLVFIIEGPNSAFPDPDAQNRLNPDIIRIRNTV